MNRKLLFLVSLLLAFYINCNAKELKGFGNPKIGKIVQISKVLVLSKDREGVIYPKYEIEIMVKEKFTIVALLLKTNYLFGQDLNLISSKEIYLYQKDLDILNNKRSCILTVELDPIKKETIKHEFSEGKLNEERISNSFIYLKYK